MINNAKTDLQLSVQKERSGFWNGTLFGTLLGMGTLIAYQYFSGILRQPRLISKEIFSEDSEFENREALAMFIATENLRSGIQPRFLTGELSKEILHAGYRNFRESWARDFGFATYGLLALEQFEVVKDTLEAFFWHQTPEGQLPVKLHSMSVVTRFFYSLFEREQPTKTPLKPKYVSGHGSPSLDGQAMLVVAAHNYAQEAEDFKFLQDHWSQLRSAVAWLQLHRGDDDGVLLSQGPYTDWADSVARKGQILYTNVVYWKALLTMGLAATSLDFKKEASLYFAEAETVSRAIHENFWRPDLGYFVTSDQLDQLSSAGNLLAIAWGVASAAQAESILKLMEEAGMANPVPTRVVYPSYPSHLISMENVLGGLANYHTNASWLWIGAWHVIALANNGHLDQAQEIMSRIAETIVRDRQVNEVHGPDGKPLESIWYKSESPLTWNAGMVVYAYSILESKVRAETNLLSVLNETLE
ncbi:MAG: amylo-alpha-1,6-glucosidase [Anaerolineales bacterium]